MRIIAVTNMYPTPQDPTLGTFVEQQINGLKQIGVTVETLLVDRVQNGMSAYFSIGRKLRLAMADVEPDIVHSMYGGVMADMATRAVDAKPTVVSFCGDDLLGELLSGPVRKFISKYGIIASYRAARRAKGIIVKSRNLEAALPAGIPSSKVRIIPNGIDLDRFKPLDRDTCRLRLGWDSEKLNVLFPANTNDPRKRPELARAAATEAQHLGVKVEIHQLRGVAHQEVPLWINASDAVLLTSLHEGSPNLIKEALACNVPVVSVDVGDVRERIRGIDGCFISEADPNDIANKLRLVACGPRRVDSRDHVRDLSLQNVALRLKQFYEDLLQNDAPKKRPPFASTRLSDFC